ncbi:hypothetical protein PoB_007089700 [Plakobranchus ocellatus]|uniref:Secreted protein n=1 Tax=Plakobranchus ocellatus TaxID=259542 RepID=A0AAV4DK22_9GAST|nr:hypothetical protein PoB_007089700 [Plakobranchus ocellatus]
MVSVAVSFLHLLIHRLSRCRGLQHVTEATIPRSAPPMSSANSKAPPTLSLPEPPRASTKARQSVEMTTCGRAAPSRYLLIMTRRHSISSHFWLHDFCPTGPHIRDVLPSGHWM